MQFPNYKNYNCQKSQLTSLVMDDIIKSIKNNHKKSKTILINQKSVINRSSSE